MAAATSAAGTFGASLAWHLAGRGDDVTLIDQFEPGDVRATSGGETRLIRCGHGTDADYTAMARRARTLWRELERETGASLYSETGVSWFAHSEDGWEAKSEATLRALGIPVALGPDDPLLFGPRLVAQYESAREALGFSDDELARLALGSVEASRAPESLKKTTRDDIADWLAATEG